MFERCKLLGKIFGLDEAELSMFYFAYQDAVAFNKYLLESKEYINFDFESVKSYIKLFDFFELNGIDKETQKKIITQMPMILSCRDYNSQVKLIYKGGQLEGIIITDDNGVEHPYRLKKSGVSLIENKALLDDLVFSDGFDYQKSYYIKMK